MTIDFGQMANDLNEIKKILSLTFEKSKDIEYMTIEKVAEYTGLKVITIREHKDNIGYFQPVRKLLFKKSDVDNWIEKTYNKSIKI